MIDPCPYWPKCYCGKCEGRRVGANDERADVIAFLEGLASLSGSAEHARALLVALHTVKNGGHVGAAKDLGNARIYQTEFLPNEHNEKRKV